MSRSALLRITLATALAATLFIGRPAEAAGRAVRQPTAGIAAVIGPWLDNLLARFAPVPTISWRSITVSGEADLGHSIVPDGLRPTPNPNVTGNSGTDLGHDIDPNG